MMTNAVPSTNAAEAEITLGDDILGIRGPVDIPTGWEWLWWTLGALAAIAATFFLLRYVVSKIKVQRPPRIPYVPPHVIARQKLQRALQLISNPYRFCSVVSDALREYVEGRFEIHAPERTTDEFLEEMRSHDDLSADQQQLMADFLIQCDLAKFARNEPTEEQLRQLQQVALDLVEQTVPVAGPTLTNQRKETVAA